jgi:predicted DNA-binding ribbon-helix-helix protein
MCRIYRSRFLRECLGQGVKLKERGHEIIRREALSRPCGTHMSVSLEEPFWRALKDIAGSRRTTLSDLISSIDHERKHGNLSSALRLFVLNHYQARAA